MVERNVYGDKKQKTDGKIPVIGPDFAVIGETPPPHASDAVLEAVGRIFSETTELNGGVTKAEVYKALLGTEARRGRTIVVDNKEKHIKGHYELHPGLSKREVDNILNAAILTLAHPDTRIIHLMGALLDGALAKARTEKKSKHKK